MERAVSGSEPTRTVPGKDPVRSKPRRAGSGARRKGLAASGTPRNDDSDMRALSNISWPEGPLTLMATDFADLECDKPARTLEALLELCRHIDRDEVLILNLEYLSWERSPHAVDTRRVGMLSDTVERTCRRMNVFAPCIAIEERGGSTDMRISLTTVH